MPSCVSAAAITISWQLVPIADFLVHFAQEMELEPGAIDLARPLGNYHLERDVGPYNFKSLEECLDQGTVERISLLRPVEQDACYACAFESFELEFRPLLQCRPFIRHRVSPRGAGLSRRFVRVLFAPGGVSLSASGRSAAFG
jgi:hypothetical protein